MAYLGKYYAFKIEGATYLHMCREMTDQRSEHQQMAIGKLSKAAGFWLKYAALAKQNYVNPLWTNRVGVVDWDQISQWTEDDINMAKSAL
jgi:hypothetical protein